MCWLRASIPHPITATFSGFFVASIFMLVLNRPGFDPAPGICPAGPPSGFQPARIKAHAAAKGKGKAACHYE
jgi:hypothetical protein